MKNTPNRFGLVALIIIFLILYGYFSTFGTPSSQYITDSNIFGGQTITVGQLGGFHLLRNVTYSDERAYYRVTIDTQLNRPSIIEQEIITPFAKVAQISNDAPVLFGNESKMIPSLGEWRIQVDLSDTRTFDLSGDTAVPVFAGQDIVQVNEDPITDIRVHYPPDDAMVQVLIGLTQQSRFRVSNNGAGAIFIDILK